VNINVYHFLLDHRIGGPHIYVDTLRRTIARNLTFRMITTGRGTMTDMALVNLRHIWNPLYVLEVPLNVVILLIWAFIGRLNLKDTLFVVHGVANLAPLIAARILCVPVIWHFHETTPMLSRFVSVGRQILKNSQHKIAVVAMKSIEAYKLNDAVFLPPFVNSKFWSKNKVNESERRLCDWMRVSASIMPIRVLAVGNLNPLKGMDILIEAMKAIKGPWHLKIVGATLTTHRVYADSLLQSAAEINSKTQNMQIEILDWQDSRQVRALMSTCDLFVVPSRSEACPIVLLEAMKMGCRIVAADVGDVALMTKLYPSIRLFSAGNIKECSNAIETMRYEPFQEAKLNNIYRLKSVVEKTEFVYLQCLNRK
jgi:glycosyltransferase involved in cell wall biosynthesis